MVEENHQAPKTFISYSHDSPEHKSWVKDLATKLRQNGIDVILDQWDLGLGNDVPMFMEKSVTAADRVLMICTEKYVHKANEGSGGVGYEAMIVTGELVKNLGTSKFIPVIRQDSAQPLLPKSVGTRLYVNLGHEKNYQKQFEELLRELHNAHRIPKPPLGQSPFSKGSTIGTASDTVSEVLPLESLGAMTTDVKTTFGAALDITHRSGDDSLPSIKGKSSTVFFNHRFGKAFPGVRGIEWFRNSVEAVKRLQILFSEPFVFRDAQPIWWWRSGDMYIQHFSTLLDDTVLLDHQEITIDELAAVNAGSYYQEYIYIKAKPSPPSGLYDISQVPEQVALVGFAGEEFALFRGRPITRAEYDDGAAVIDGNVVDLKGEALLRERFLTPYNFIIAPHESPINNNRFDKVRDELLNRILRGEATVEELTSAVLKLPRREDYNRR